MVSKYVRVLEVKDDKYILFDFAIGEPDLSVELILPPKAFVEFCQANQVIYMTPAQGAQVDMERLTWRHGDSDR
ncbi:MAG TPA: phenol hydroxylase subunit [Noviherbaspirillum sp.]|uniref:phenol hydroxylase subunit n=1 Tax=Noviherbaspirillum sp. TaxID=1926288 RepID=UPI002B47C42A|nr:phenol hydroxylase subunit [Noviherbaspirillum sp.]HJV84978.1 phenol hydroxylase subunit [Noviherbaspirillum sp.]